jgi:hypothetical protein
MKIRPTAPVRLGATTALVTSCLVIASVACAATSADGSYSGKTSQKQTISFRIASGSVRVLRYRIDDRCPGGKRLSIRAWGFPPLRIKRGHFGGTFVAKAPASAKAIVTGTVSRRAISGVLTDRTRNRRTRRLCTGRATFSLARRAAARASDAPGLRQVALSITMPLANERPVGPKNTSKFRRSWIPE